MKLPLFDDDEHHAHHDDDDDNRIVSIRKCNKCDAEKHIRRALIYFNFVLEFAFFAHKSYRVFYFEIEYFDIFA